MANKVTSIVKLNDLVVAGTLSGDLLLWDLDALMTKVDERLHVVNKSNEKPEDSVMCPEDQD